MEGTESRTVLILLLAVVAIVGAIAAAVLFAGAGSPGSGMGGMMGGSNPTGPGASSWVWVLLIVSLAAFALAVGFLFSGRTRQPVAEPVSPQPDAAASVTSSRTEGAPSPEVVSAPLPSAAPVSEAGDGRLSELTLTRVLGEDERRMYLVLREHDGTMTQKDLVGLGLFSRAKVSRVLDKLEAKGIVVRERAGMTNRVRIVGRVAR